VEDLFDFRELRIRQPAKLLAGHASYEIFDTQRRLLAVASEAEGRSRLQTLSGLVPGTRTLGVRTAAGAPVLMLIMRDNEWAADVTDSAGQPVGRIRVGDTRRHYTLLDSGGLVLGKAAGDLAVKNFSVTSAEGGPLAQVTKTWAGLRKELLTSADHYTVKFAGSQPPSARVLTIMMAIVLDLVRHE
jgi:hypothetical protein